MAKRVTMVCLFLFISTTVLPVEAQFGMIKTRIHFDVEHAPEKCIPGQQVQLVLEAQNASAQPALTVLRDYFDPYLRGSGYELIDERPDTKMRLVVDRLTQRIDLLKANETHNISLGRGKCDDRTVEVTRVRVYGSSSLSCRRRSLRFRPRPR